MSQTARKTAYYGIITALGLILSYVETLIPVNLGVPGAKLGLANLVVLLCLRAPHDSFRKNVTGAFLVGLLRIVLSGFLFGNLFSIAYSLAGFAAALLCEGLMEYVNEKRSRRGIATCACFETSSSLLLPKAQTRTEQGTAAGEEAQSTAAGEEAQSTAAGEEARSTAAGEEARSTAASEVFGLTCISAVGGVMHNMGQLAVAAVLCGTPVLAYLPWLIIFGIAAGLVTGILGVLLIKRVKNFI